ncbi:hypothetical protein DYB32_005806 [Aphanomyces invadans]|uniref:DUF659 domain-containing protein n=1 Tax=Aphanomyces invadans TaxID=157072 RepID=A0A3R6WKD5_9STRA|nr:hypothetical protein DYB32_005806 [Aphanomyces invadans]
MCYPRTDCWVQYADFAGAVCAREMKAACPAGSYKCVNFLSDAWENTAKTHILVVQLALGGLSLTFGAFRCGNRHDVQSESILSMIEDGWNVGAIITDNAGPRDRARRILAVRWPKIVFHFCYAHQMNLLVKDTIASAWQITVAQAHDVVSMLNQSTAKWLSRLRDSMKTV